MRENEFWGLIRNILPFAWRMEDLTAVGRPDVLYRFEDRYGVIELKSKDADIPLGRPFVTGLTREQSINLMEWGRFGGGRAWLLVQVNGRWLLFPWHNLAVKEYATKRTLKEYSELAAVQGDLNRDGLLLLRSLL
jgi:Holliday junction resolvase